MKPALVRLMAVLFAVSAPFAHAEETLILHHFLGPKTPTHADFIAPWAKRVEEASGGELKIKIYPSMTLGGKPPELYRQVRDGAVDLAWTVVGYTPGVFPRSEVFELPSVHRGDARATNLAIADVYADMLADDFRDVHPILIHTHAGNALHLTDKAVRRVADLKGLKLRTPSRSGGWMIDAWGAEAVGMPLPSLTQALSKGVVEGALIPFEVVLPTKTHELTRYSLEGDFRFGTSVFLLAMNKDRYAALPARLRAVLDSLSRANIAGEYGVVWNGNEAAGKQAQLNSGGEIIELSAAARDNFAAKADEVESRWIREANAAGLGGAELVAAAKAAIAKHSR